MVEAWLAMATKSDKIYVAIGNNDPQEGFATLEWALQKWSSHSISIVILHSKYYKYIYTYVTFSLELLRNIHLLM